MHNSINANTRRSRTAQPRTRAACTFAILSLVSLSANAVLINIDTSAQAGNAAVFSVTLLDGDFVANNVADVSLLVTDAQLSGVQQCVAGCPAIPSFRLDDASGFAELTVKIASLGTFIQLNLDFTQAFSTSGVGASSDLIIGELLNLADFHTNLNAPVAPVPYQDAVFVVNVATNSVVGAAGITTVPTPASLGLLAAGVAVLAKRRGCSALRSFAPSTT